MLSVFRKFHFHWSETTAFLSVLSTIHILIKRQFNFQNIGCWVQWRCGSCSSGSQFVMKDSRLYKAEWEIPTITRRTTLGFSQSAIFQFLRSARKTCVASLWRLMSISKCYNWVQEDSVYIFLLDKYRTALKRKVCWVAKIGLIVRWKPPSHQQHPALSEGTPSTSQHLGGKRNKCSSWWVQHTNRQPCIQCAKPSMPHPILCGRPNSHYLHLF